jgi:AraC-like DNA-binding protein
MIDKSRNPECAAPNPRGATEDNNTMGEQPFFSLDGPLDAMPVNGQMRIANLAGFPALVRSLGADPIALMERYGINPMVLRDPDHYMDCKAFVDLLEYCSSSFNNSLFGLQLAQQQDAEVFGCVAALCRSAATVREAVESFIEYIPVVHSPTTVLQLVEGKDTAEIRWSVRSDLGNNSQANYQAAVLDIKFLQLVSGGVLRPSYVNLAVDARPKDIPELERKLGCRFHQTQGDNAVAFPVAILDQPVPSASRLVFKLLGGYLDQVRNASRKTIVERVEDYVRGTLSSGNCTIERCASNFGVSVRTLQTNLAEQGLKFSDILDKHRLRMASAYLGQQYISLDDVAAKLGYSEQSSFGRAFKRWTGVTPKQYRVNQGLAAEAVDDTQPGHP